MKKYNKRARGSEGVQHQLPHKPLLNWDCAAQECFGAGIVHDQLPTSPTPNRRIIDARQQGCCAEDKGCPHAKHIITGIQYSFRSL